MLAIKFVLLAGSLTALVAALFILLFDAHKVMYSPEPVPVRWRRATRLMLLAVILLLPGLSIVVVPSGMAGVRVSQLSGTLGGALYPGTHFVTPLIQRVGIYNVRDQIYSTNAADGKDRPAALKVYSKEGLPLGLGVSVRYQLDPKRLPYIESNLPKPVETELMPTVVANAFRETISGYMVRDVFSTKREEVRRVVADTITRKLAADGIVVKEVMLRDINLPPEYAKGLEGLLVKAAGERSAVDRGRNEAEDGAHRGARSRRRQSQAAETVGRTRPGDGARGQGAGRRHAVHAAAQGEADSAEPP